MINFSAPVVDSCLQPGGAPILGPVWVSTGEGFDPKGAYDYSLYLKKYVKKKLKETKTYKSNVSKFYFFIADEDVSGECFSNL